MKRTAILLSGLTFLAGTVSSAVERSSSAGEVHTRAVEDAVLRFLASPELGAAQRALIEDGLQEFVRDRADFAESLSPAASRSTRPTLVVSESELATFRPGRDEEPETELPEEVVEDPVPPSSPHPEPPRSEPEEIESAPEPVLPFGGITCIPGNELLLGGRFLVRATVTDLLGNVFIAGACRMTNVAGYFFFFDPTNVEVPVKMLNACGGGNPPTHWIFITGLTNFGVQTTFFDLLSGISLTHTNARGVTFPSSINQQTPFPCL